MSNNNNKQPPDLTDSLLVFDGISLVERRSRDVKPREKNDSLDILEINQPDVTTGNLSHSDEASTSTPIIDLITEVNQSPYYVDQSDDETIGFLIDCAEKGENLGKQRPPSICKVSRIFLRDQDESLFTPQLVSIGPIHREDPKLKEFEWLKYCYLDDLLDRCNSTRKKMLEACLLKVNNLLPKIKESYAGMIKNYRDVELATMMVMDGCFILEFGFKAHEKEDEEGWHLPNVALLTRIVIDLILLENQVPFVVLQALFDCLAPHMVTRKGPVTLSQILDDYLAQINCFDSRLPEEIPTTDVDSDLPEKFSNIDVDHDHILGYLHTRYQLVAAKSSNRIKDAAFHSIVELDRSGMNFKPHQEDDWSMTIKFQSSLFACLPWFWSKPTLIMPTLVIEDSTELMLRNFIAYEQSFPHVRSYFTSYAYAMCMLIDTQEDIAKLVESKVLLNALGSNQEAADMINKIGKNVFVTEFYYNQEFKQVDKYYNRFLSKHIAFLRRVYFSNPWSTIALLAAIILFGLTVVQTIFTIKGK